MISDVGRESWFELRPKVIVEDDKRRPKVVVVEDDVLLRMRVSDALRSEGFQVLEAATTHSAFLLFKSVPDVGVVISDMRVIGAMEDGALVGMPASDYLRHCGYRVLEAGNSDEALLLLQNPDTQVDVVMIDVGGSGAMSGYKLTQRVHTFLASWGLGRLAALDRAGPAGRIQGTRRTRAAAPASRRARQEHSRSEPIGSATRTLTQEFLSQILGLRTLRRVVTRPNASKASDISGCEGTHAAAAARSRRREAPRGRDRQRR